MGSPGTACRTASHAPDQVAGTSIGANRGAGGHHHLPDPVQPDCCLRHLGKLGWGLGGDRGTGPQGLLDGAELTALVLAVADAGLYHRGGQHISTVQAGDLLVGHTVDGD